MRIMEMWDDRRSIKEWGGTRTKHHSSFVMPQDIRGCYWIEGNFQSLMILCMSTLSYSHAVMHEEVSIYILTQNATPLTRQDRGKGGTEEYRREEPKIRREKTSLTLRGQPPSRTP